MHRWFGDPDHVVLVLFPFLGHLVPVTGSHTQVDQGWVDKLCLEISPSRLHLGYSVALLAILASGKGQKVK